MDINSKREQLQLDRTGYQPTFTDDFTESLLDPDRWVAHYLPHWTTPDRSAARYDLETGVLRFRIDADQSAWLAADGEMRASNIQTGTFSGLEGSTVGQHHHRSGLTVVTPQPDQRLYLPTATADDVMLVEAELRASAERTVMLAFWLVGFEESPEQSGELCVAELFGHAIKMGRTSVNIGLKAHHDARLREDMRTVTLDIDATDWHTYGVEWTKDHARFFVDDRLVRTVDQGMGYPLQVMVDLFEFPESSQRPPEAYPKVGEVRSVRGYQRRRSH